MFSPPDVAAAVISKLHADPRFESFNIIKAFTPEILETEPEKPLIAVSCGTAEYSTEYSDSASEQSVKRGTFTVNLGVYLPFYLGYDSGSMQAVLAQLLSCLLSTAPSGIKISATTADSATRCLTATCAFTFSSLLPPPPAFTIARQGENAFLIARRCHVTVDDIMRLNPAFLTPFSIPAGARVRLKERRKNEIY